MLKSIITFMSFALFSVTLPAVEPTRVLLANFSAADLSDWEEKSFVGHTDYQIVELDGSHVLQAESEGSASSMYKAQKIDLQKTPYLNWRWRIEDKLNTKDETTQADDDYAARVYVVIGHKYFIWKTVALSYVWANGVDKGDHWNNSYAGDSVKMTAVRSNEAKASTWYMEKRNVYEDLKASFGEEMRYIDGVALMTDSDNTKGHSRAYYGDIYFSTE